MSANGSSLTHWHLHFLGPDQRSRGDVSQARDGHKYALIILNQPFSRALLDVCWKASEWRSCADGGANKLHDLLSRSAGGCVDERSEYTPDLIKGDFDSLKPEVRLYYQSRGVPIVQDNDQDSTDLMKCVESARAWAGTLGPGQHVDFIILGGLSGRLDQTVHTLSYIHKLRKDNRRVFVVTDDNVGWVLKEGEHIIHVDHHALGPTCGLLPVGIDLTTLTTEGLKWNLTNHPSCFDGMVSTSNAVVSNQVRIVTTKPIWWCIELSGLVSR